MNSVLSRPFKGFAKTLLGLCFGVFLLLSPAKSAAEALIVLEYNGAQSAGSSVNDNAFVQDHNHSSEHVVGRNETLSSIMNKYYRSSGLNREFLSLAIVQANPKAFVRQNPNYLFAGRKLRLPSVNEIQSMILGQKTSSSNMSSGKVSDEIFFFGN
ncbi:MAG: hypothetical protein CML73_03960 [Rhodobiaceae bacterium]|nr:hypothetical protein [Rhodobiaceae bacterium]